VTRLIAFSHSASLTLGEAANNRSASSTSLRVSEKSLGRLVDLIGAVKLCVPQELAQSRSRRIEAAYEAARCCRSVLSFDSLSRQP
jgi:hypothetical protein